MVICFNGSAADRRRRGSSATSWVSLAGASTGPPLIGGGELTTMQKTFQAFLLQRVRR